MPTGAEINELVNTDNCTWSWTTQGGKNGYLATSKKNGNSIFLPVTGYIDDITLLYADSFGRYWSSSLYTNYSWSALSLRFDSDNYGRRGNDRYVSLPVRPAYP